MKIIGKILLSAAILLCGGACVTNAQEKTTAAGVPVVTLNPNRSLGFLSVVWQ